MSPNPLSKEGVRRYAGSTGWLVAERILKSILGLSVGVMVARYLGPQDYGLLSFAVSLVGVFTVLATLGLDNIVVRELVRHDTRSGILLGTAVLMRLTGALALLLLIAGALFLTDWQVHARPLVLVVALSTLFQAFWLIDCYFQAQVQGRRLAIPRMLAHIVGATVKISLIAAHADVFWFAVALVIENALIAIGLLISYHSARDVKDTWGWQPSTARKLLKDGWPLLLAGFAVSLYMKIDQVMLQQMIGPEAVGHYAAAVVLSEAWYFVPMAICASIFPALINARSNRAFYEDRLQKLYDLMIVLGFVVACLITISADLLVQTLLGDRYQLSGTVLTIHVWAGIFVALGIASTRWLVAEGLEIISFYRTAAGAVTNVVLNLVLIPRWGINGAALATLLSYAISSYLSLAVLPRTRKNFFLATRAFLIHRAFTRLARLPQ